MGKYSITFEITVEVNEPEINEGEIDEVVYDNGLGLLSDNAFNYIVSDALDIMEDIENCVTQITRIEDDDDEDDDE